MTLRVCILGISEVAFYGLLKDPVFVDYFNVFLSLPVRLAVFMLFFFVLTVHEQFLLLTAFVKNFYYQN